MAEALFTSLKQVYLDIGTARIPMIGVVLSLSEAPTTTNKTYSMPGVSHRAILDMITHSDYITAAQGFGTRGSSSSDPAQAFSSIYSGLPVYNTVLDIYGTSIEFKKERVSSFQLWRFWLYTHETSNNVYVSIQPTAGRASSGTTYDYTAGFLFIDGSTGHILASDWSSSNNGYVCKFSDSSIHSLIGGIYPVLSFAGGTVPFYGYSDDINIKLRDLEISPYIPPTDPYGDIPDSEPGSGDGTFDFDSSDDIPFSSPPALSAVSTGFVSLWCPQLQQIKNLASYMWNATGSIINFIKNLIADPLDLILGLNIFPVELTPTGTTTVSIGIFNTGVEMDYIESQWFVVDCGTLQIPETWGAYLDYDPYTKIEIYLPYCGTHPLRVDDFMDGEMSVLYNVDLMSGSCVAMVKNAHSVLYTFMGHCSTEIPVTAEQYGALVQSLTRLASNIGETSVTGPGAYPSIASSAVDTVMALKPSIGRSGAIGGAAGLMCPQKPYITMTRPRQAHPENQNTYMGYPAIFTASLADLTGYTEIQSIHLHGITGTQAEVDELENLLKSGVIF